MIRRASWTLRIDGTFSQISLRINYLPELWYADATPEMESVFLVRGHRTLKHVNVDVGFYSIHILAY